MKKSNVIIAIGLIITLVLMVVFLSPSMGNEDDNLMYVQTLEEVTTRVSSENINDLMEGMDFAIAAGIATPDNPTTPGDFVYQYANLDPRYISYLEDYFGVTIR